jgi:hypothetical protein
MVLAPASRYAQAALQKGVDGLWRLARAITETGLFAGGSGVRASGSRCGTSYSPCIRWRLQ